MLGIARQQNQVIQNYIQQPTAPQQPQYQQQGYQNQQQGTQQPGYDEDAPLTPRMLRELAPTFLGGQQQDTQRAIDMAASGNLESIRRDHADDFNRWGHEINNALAGIPKKDWTVENLRKVVRFVRADHVDEIAEAKAQRLVAERPGSEVLRSTGGSVPVSGTQPNADLTLKSERLPAEYRERLAKVGLTEAGLDDFCRANGMTREGFFAQFGNTAITEQYTQRG